MFIKSCDTLRLRGAPALHLSSPSLHTSEFSNVMPPDELSNTHLGRSGPFHYPGQLRGPKPWGVDYGHPSVSDGSDTKFGYGPITSRPPYSRWDGLRPGLGHMNQPLYYDPRNPHSWRANASVMNYTDPYHNAAYLPRTQAYDADPGHQPGFGYIPTTRVHPDEHPFHFRGRFFHPEHNGTKYPHVSNMGPEHVYRGYRSVIPYDVPIPGYHHNSPDPQDNPNGEWYQGTSHPVYAAWYEPGVTPGDAVHKNIFAFPKPNNREHKVAKPQWFDEPQSWPGYDFDKYAKFTVPTRPVPPPPEGETIKVPVDNPWWKSGSFP
jgi:hypothetical protein